MKRDTVFESAARTGTPAATVRVPLNLNDSRGVYILVDITAVSGGETIQPRLQMPFTTGGAFKILWTAAAALSTVTTAFYYIGINAGAATGDLTETAGRALPDDIILDMNHSGSGSITYSVEVVYPGA